jgi:hypothetical protein
MMGHDGYNCIADMAARKFAKHVRTSLPVCQFQQSVLEKHYLMFACVLYHSKLNFNVGGTRMLEEKAT